MKSPFSRLAVLIQAMFVLLVFLTGYLMLRNAIDGMNRLGIAFGFGFLQSEASFPISDKMIDYEPSDSYAKALGVGLTNTLKVSVLAIFLASMLGAVIGLARMTRNFALKGISAIYIEVFRNTPLLVQVFIWYFAVFLQLPRVEESFQMFQWVSISNQGILVSGASITPEFASVLAGLAAYTSAYIAEIIRSGIQAVSKDQWDAAKALGLTPSMAFRHVIFPQAIRIIIPPLSSQYMTLIKNSSLSISVGYPDLFSVSGTILNQTGRTMEMITIMLLIYLCLSLLSSLLMNLYFKTNDYTRR